MNIQQSSRTDILYVLIALLLGGGIAILINFPNPTLGYFALAGLLGIVLVIAIYIQPELGAYVLIVSVFTNISAQLTNRGLPSINKPLVALVALTFFIRYLYAGNPFPNQRRTGILEGFLIALFIVTALSYLPAANKERAVEAILDLGKDIVIIYCIFFAVRNVRNWTQAAWIIMLITTALSLMGSYQMITGNYEQTFLGLARVQRDTSVSSPWRLAGPINEPNMWGQIVVAVLPLAIYRLLHEKSLGRKGLALLMITIMAVEVLNTYSRGAYLAGLIVLILVLMSRRNKVAMALASLGLAIVLFSFLPSSYKERFLTLSILTSDRGIYGESSFRGRSSEMLAGLNMFYDHPILGIGAGNYPNNYLRYAQHLGIEVRYSEREAHSLYIQILAETGLLGIITFIGFVVSLLIHLQRSYRTARSEPELQNWAPWVRAITLSVTGYLITSIFLHGAFLRFFWIFVALAIAAIQISDDLRLQIEHTRAERRP